MAKPDPHEPITEQMLNKATDAILEGVGSMFKDSRGRLDGTYKRFDGMDKRLDKVGRRLDTLEVGQSYLKDQINGLKADLSDTPSRRQFKKLKDRLTSTIP